MTMNNRGFSLISSLAILTLLIGCAHTVQTENLLRVQQNLVYCLHAW